MKPTPESLAAYYAPLIAEFLEELKGVPVPEIAKMPEPFFPVFGAHYADSAMRLIVIGRDTRGWGDLREFLRHPAYAAESRIGDHFDEFEEREFRKWGGNRYTFWGFAFMLLAALHGRSNWELMKQDAMREILESFAWGNCNAIELFVSTVKAKGVPPEFWEKVRRAGDRFDRFRHIVATVRPNVAIVTWQGMDPRRYFEGLVFERVAREDGITHYRLPQEQIDVFHVPHPNNMKYNEGADHFCTQLCERLLGAGLIARFPDFLNDKEAADETMHFLRTRVPPLDDGFDKYAFLSRVAEELAKRGTFMSVPTLARLANAHGCRTNYGTEYEGGRGTYRLVRGAYWRQKNLGTDEGDSKAHNIAVAFRRPNFEYAYSVD